jgi:hypothetical protein
MAACLAPSARAIARQVAEIFSGGLGWPDEDHLVHNSE